MFGVGKGEMALTVVRALQLHGVKFDGLGESDGDEQLGRKPVRPVLPVTAPSDPNDPSARSQ